MFDLFSKKTKKIQQQQSIIDDTNKILKLKDNHISNIKYKSEVYLRILDIISESNLDVVKTMRLIASVLLEVFPSDQVWIVINKQKDGMFLSELIDIIGYNKFNIPSGVCFDLYKIFPNHLNKLIRNESLILYPSTIKTSVEEEFFSTFENKTLAIIPISFDKAVWGAFGISNFTSIYKFTQDDLYFLEMLSKLLKVYIKNKIESENILNRDKILDKLKTNIKLYSWYKDVQGQYVYVDPKWVDLFYPDLFKFNTIVGETDLSSIKKFRSIKGNTHTFGELCQGTDDICYKNNKTSHFIEIGIINDNVLSFHVIKQPVYKEVDNIKTIDGIIGCGHDISFIGEIKLNKILQSLVDKKYIVEIENNPTVLLKVYEFKDMYYGYQCLLDWYKYFMVGDVDNSKN